LSKIFTRLYNKGNNIKRMLIILLMLSMAAGIFTACSSSKNTDNSGKFTVGFDAEFPPYGYKDDNGEYVGFDLDLAQAVCDKNGWTLVKQPKDMELNSGTIDCIWNGFTMTGREKDYTWSSAYIDNSQVVIVKSDAQINNLSDLAGKVVAVQSDSSALAAFTGEDASESNIQLAKSFSSLQQVGDYNSAFMNLESGSVDAICMDIGVAGYELKARGNSFRMLSEHVSSEEYGIGFKKGNTKLRDQVQETLNEMLADGTFMDIAKKWNVDESVCLGQEGKDSVMKAEGASDGSGSQNGFTDILGQLSTGMISTLGIFVLTLIFSLPLGLLLTFIRMSKLKVLQWIAKIYISIMRGTPLMLQLLVVFFGPYYLFGVSLSYSYRFYAVIIGFSLNYAAYFAEIYRAGIEGVPKGQYEAADVLGYSKAQTFIKIIFPQMVKAVLPPVTNEVITLVKDTSLAFALAYTEMFTLAKQVAATQASIMPLFVAGLFYYIFNFIVAYIMERLEKKMQYYR
jgi:His/Glu/Gln/Arg/opine family amino acid ABC transporter permease subunit